MVISPKVKKILTYAALVVLVCIGVLVGLPLPVEAVDCSRSAGGNVTISSSCTFPASVDGADAGTGTSNTAVISVGSGTTLTVSAGQTVAAGSLDMTGTGTVAIVATGQIKPGSPLWMYDADADGYPKESTMAAQSTQPPGHRRRNLMTSMTQRDCQDFYNSDYNCQPVTGDLSSGTHGGTFEESSGTPALSYRELAKDNATVGLWHMNEASGTSVADSSGNGNTGTATGTTVVSGKLGNARSFNGTSDYVAFSSITGLPQGANARTYEAWVYPTSDIPTSPWDLDDIIDSGDNGTNNTRFGIGRSNDNKVYVVGRGNDITGSLVIPTNQWSHVAASYDGTNVNIFVNGVKDPNSTTKTYNTTGTETSIGRYNDAASDFFPGIIDEVRISNVARTPEEIKAAAQRRPYAVYTAPVNDLGQTPGSWTGMTVQAKGVKTGDGETPHSTNSLVAAWNFNETSGTTATNNATAVSCGGTPSNCNGTLTNFASTASQDQAAGTGWTSANRRWGAGALMFDGGNDYVGFGSDTSLDSINTAFTVEYWQRLDKKTNAEWMSKYGAAKGFSFGWWNGQFEGYVYGDQNSVTNAPTSYFKTGEWQHIVFTYSSGSYVRIYVDGVLAGEDITSIPTTLSGQEANNFEIGKNGAANFGAYFPGTIDSVRYFSRALSASEILANYQAGNIEFQTRTSADNATWEAWKPVTSETQLLSQDSISPITQISQTSLISYWTLDETSGTRADSKGSNTLTDNATVTYAPGRLSNAAQFTSANSEYLSIADNADLSTGDIDFTVAGWVYLDSKTGTDEYIVAKIGTAYEYSLYYLGTGGQDRFAFDIGGGVVSIWSTAGSPALGTWYFVVGWHDSVANTMNIQINNGSVDSTSTGVNVPSDTTATFNIGARNTGAYERFWNGRIDEVAFWKRTLTAAERTQLFEDGLDLHAAGSGRVYRTRDTVTKIEGTASEKLSIGSPQVDSSTVGAWHMEETSGTGAYIKDSVPAPAQRFSPDTSGTLANNLAAYWKLDESSGTRIDSFGTGNLTDLNTVTSNPGKQGTAGQFTRTNTEYLKCTDSECPNTSTGNIDFTVSAWVYLDTTPEDVNFTILGKGWSGGDEEYRLIYSNGATDVFQLQIGGANGYIDTGVSHGTTPSAATWYFVVAWHDAAADTINIQVNNGTVASTSTAGSAPVDGTGAFTIGTWAGSPNWAWNGRIDEVAIWKKVLTTQERTDLYNTGSGQTYKTQNHGTPTGTTVVDGFYGKGRSFNGTSDYVEILDSASLDVTKLTIEAWIKRDRTATQEEVVGKIGLDIGAYRLLIDSANNLACYLGDEADADNITIARISTTGELSQIGRWYHVVCTWDGSASVNGIKIYIDGKEPSSTTDANGVFSSIGTDANLRIGTKSNGANFFDGVIDGVRISNTNRAAEEIAEAYRAGAQHRISRSLSTVNLSQVTKLPFYVAADRPGTYLEATVGESAFANGSGDSSTVGLWHLEEQTGSGAYIKDSSGYGYNGTPTGTTFSQGKIGKARKFNGSSDFVDFGSNTNFQPGTGDFTVSMWFTRSSAATSKTLISTLNPACSAGETGIFMRISSSGAFGDTGFFGASCAPNIQLTSPTLPVDQWTHAALVRSGGNAYLYVNGALVSSGSGISGTNIGQTASLTIGKDNYLGGSGFHDGLIDEVRLDKGVARTADEIRQAYEVGKRTHPITIDFAAKGDAGNLITSSADLSFTVDATSFGAQNKGDNLFVGDKVIVRENVGGTEYSAQSTVNSVTASTGAVTVSAWDSGGTFPSGGFTANAHFFKWQREYFDVTGSLAAQRDAITRLTLRVTNGHEGRSVWLDDFKSASYINRGTCDTLNTSTGVCTHLIPSASVTSTLNRYFQTRMIFSSWDPAVSATLTSSQIEYGL